VDDLVDLGTVEVIDPNEVLPNIDAHGYLQGVYQGTIKPNGSRLRAAIAALPFERPKLSAIAVGTANDLADRLMHALQATNKVINARPMQVIEAPKPVEAEPLDHSGPFPANNKSRFRRI
jgi:hypothetical protein